AGLFRDAVDAPALFGLLRHHGQAELLLERPGDGYADRVGLPAKRLRDLSDGRALGSLQHGDELGLLGAVPTLRRRNRLGRRLWLSAGLGLGFGGLGAGSPLWGYGSRFRVGVEECIRSCGCQQRHGPALLGFAPNGIAAS